MYKPLTPDLRRQIYNSIDEKLSELNTCKSNASVSVQKVSLLSLKCFIRGLPDGYPIPMRKGDN